jgi:hypothetical protein
MVPAKRADYYELCKDPVETAQAWRKRLTAEQQERVLEITRAFPGLSWWKEGRGSNGLAPRLATPPAVATDVRQPPPCADDSGDGAQAPSAEWQGLGIVG